MPEASTESPLVTAESEPKETETIPTSQATASIAPLQKPQYEAERSLPDTDVEESSAQHESEMAQPAPIEFPSEPELQVPTDIGDNHICYCKDYAVSIDLILDNTAVDCRDTQITSSDPYYIK